MTTSPRKLAKFNQLASKLKSLERLEVGARARLKALEEEIKETRKALRPVCVHPPGHREEFTWEHDDGYGRQSQVTGEVCKLCGMKRRFTSSSFWND